jgi:hypothetical protein
MNEMISKLPPIPKKETSGDVPSRDDKNHASATKSDQPRASVMTCEAFLANLN